MNGGGECKLHIGFLTLKTNYSCDFAGLVYYRQIAWGRMNDKTYASVQDINAQDVSDVSVHATTCK